MTWLHQQTVKNNPQTIVGFLSLGRFRYVLVVVYAAVCVTPFHAALDLISLYDKISI